jgi:hypothetical protein
VCQEDDEARARGRGALNLSIMARHMRGALLV